MAHDHDYHELADRLERAYSRRIALRRVSLSDAWPLFEATRNPLFNRFLMWDAPQAPHEVLERIDAIVSAQRRGALAAMSGVVRDTGEWASLFRFQPYAADPQVMEMGVWTHHRFWHGRFTLELARMCLDACFDGTAVDRLVGAAALENEGSCQLMRLVGMRAIAPVLRTTEGGQQVELQEFEIDRAAWEADAADRARRPTHAIVPLAQAAEPALRVSPRRRRELRREMEEVAREVELAP